MQAIAEEVVSTSGGGAKYITSGFSAYNGHPAIGRGTLKLGAARYGGIGFGTLNNETISGQIAYSGSGDSMLFYGGELSILLACIVF